MNYSDAKDILSPPPGIPPGAPGSGIQLALTRAFLDGQKVSQLQEHTRLWPEREETPRYRAEIERLKTLYLGPQTATREAGQ